MKRYGITKDPERRKEELKNQYAGFKNFKVLKEFPNKAAAQDWENGKPHAQSWRW